MSGIGRGVSVGIEDVGDRSGSADGDEEPPHAASTRAVEMTMVSAHSRRQVLRMQPR